MKFNHLILSFTVATTAWAHPKLPLAFFAKVDGAFRPLSGVLSEVRDSDLKVLSYGDFLPIPTDFSLQDNYAFTGNESAPVYLGYARGMIGFSPSVYRALLEFDETMRVLNTPFKSCTLSSDKLHMIYEEDAEISRATCFEVDIYLLPYDKSTGTPVMPALVHKKGMTPNKPGSINESVKKEDSSSEDEKHEGEKHKPKKKHRKQKKNRKEKQMENGKQAPKKEMKDKPEKHQLKKDLESQISPSISSPEHPLVLAAKVKDTFIPLSRSIFGNGKTDTNTLAYKPSGDKPVLFSLQGNYAVTDNKHSPGYLGIRRGLLIFGPKVRKTRLDLDWQQKVLNARFRSCKALNTEVRYIFHGASRMPEKDCFDVEIYLSPYDPKTGNVLRFESGKEELPTVLPEVKGKPKIVKTLEGNSYTDCPTQCSKEVTVTITMCDKESNPSTVIMTTSSTVTIVSATTVTVTEV